MGRNVLGWFLISLPFTITWGMFIYLGATKVLLWVLGLISISFILSGLIHYGIYLTKEED